MDETKKCRDCGEMRPLTDFWFAKGTTRRPECRDCAGARQRKAYDPEQKRRRDLMKRYGLTAEEYDLLLNGQAASCAICERETTLHVDHDHETGRVRGLLCASCNRALGIFRDDVELLKAAIAYLTR